MGLWGRRHRTHDIQGLMALKRQVRGGSWRGGEGLLGSKGTSAPLQVGGTQNELVNQRTGIRCLLVCFPPTLPSLPARDRHADVGPGEDTTAPVAVSKRPATRVDLCSQPSSPAPHTFAVF